MGVGGLIPGTMGGGLIRNPPYLFSITITIRHHRRSSTRNNRLADTSGGLKKPDEAGSLPSNGETLRRYPSGYLRIGLERDPLSEKCLLIYAAT